MSDGWIEWAGGKCPVHPDTKIEAVFVGCAASGLSFAARADIERYAERQRADSAE